MPLVAQALARLQPVLVGPRWYWKLVVLSGWLEQGPWRAPAAQYSAAQWLRHVLSQGKDLMPGWAHTRSTTGLHALGLPESSRASNSARHIPQMAAADVSTAVGGGSHWSMPLVGAIEAHASDAALPLRHQYHPQQLHAGSLQPSGSRDVLTLTEQHVSSRRSGTIGARLLGLEVVDVAASSLAAGGTSSSSSRGVMAGTCAFLLLTAGAAAEEVRFALQRLLTALAHVPSDLQLPLALVSPTGA